MSTTANYIIELLNDDLVSHGLLAQCVEEAEDADSATRQAWHHVLKELLTGDVEIGTALKASGGYVEFVAWGGSVDERVARASDTIVHASAPEREFAFWLCLRKNVDRYEETR